MSLMIFQQFNRSKYRVSPPDLQQKLFDFQLDSFLLSRKNEHFDAFVSKEQFPYLRDFPQKMCSMFGSTDFCKSVFLIMKQIKITHETEWLMKPWMPVYVCQRLKLPQNCSCKLT